MTHHTAKTDGLDMNFAEFEHGLLPRIVVPLLAGLLVLAALQNKAAAAAPKTFVISPSEGYGVLDCIANGSACGRIVADAWCESHGHGAAMAYGKAEDITAAIPRDAAFDKAPAADSLLISCSE